MVVPRNHPPLLRSRGARAFRASLVVCLNRLLLERSRSSTPAAASWRGCRRACACGARARHTGHRAGATVRAGILDAGAANATVRWTPEPDAELELELSGEQLLAPVGEEVRPRADLLLAMPRPLQLRGCCRW